MSATAPVAGAGAAIVMLALAVPRRPVARRLPGGARARASGDGPLHRATAAVCRGLGLPVPSAAGRRTVHRTALVAALAGVIAPPLAALVVAASWLRARHDRLRRRRAAQRAVLDGLPDVVDLLVLCTTAGCSLPIAHPLVAARVSPPTGEALRAAALEADRGRARADALVDALAPLGERALALAHVLADHLRYGVPLVPSLERLGDELRVDRRHRAEQDARRVPVRLLGPLVACVLPAFALLTVVPLLAASLQSLPT